MQLLTQTDTYRPTQTHTNTHTQRAQRRTCDYSLHSCFQHSTHPFQKRSATTAGRPQARHTSRTSNNLIPENRLTVASRLTHIQRTHSGAHNHTHGARSSGTKSQRFALAAGCDVATSSNAKRARVVDISASFRSYKRALNGRRTHEERIGCAACVRTRRMLRQNCCAVVRGCGGLLAMALVNTRRKRANARTK